MKPLITNLHCPSCGIVTIEIPLTRGIFDFLATDPQCPHCGKNPISLPQFKEVKADLVKTFNADDPVDALVLSLLIALDALTFAIMSYLHAHLQEDRLAKPAQYWWAVKRIHAFTQVVSYMVEANEAFRALEEKCWFERHLPKDGNIRVTTRDSLNKLREVNSDPTIAPLIKRIRDKSGFHWDKNGIKKAYQAMVTRGVDIPIIISAGSRLDNCSPLGAEILSEIILQGGKVEEVTQAIVDIHYWFRKVVEVCVGEFLVSKGVNFITQTLV